MQMIRIKEERWIIMVVSTRRYLKFKVFMRDIFLLKIHATEQRVRTQRAPKQERYTPDDPHQLTSYDGEAAVCADTQVEAPFELFASTGIQDRHHAPIEIYRHDLVIKKNTNGPDSERLIEKSPVEKGSVNGVDALFKNKEIQGVGQTRHKGENTRTMDEWEYAGSPGHSYRRVDCLNYH
jgi:hypothetical protein